MILLLFAVCSVNFSDFGGQLFALCAAKIEALRRELMYSRMPNAHTRVSCSRCGLEMRKDNFNRHALFHKQTKKVIEAPAVVSEAPFFEWRGPNGEPGGRIEINADLL